jgi:pimeloyl-ACP methyl ester carboxylesterase
MSNLPAVNSIGSIWLHGWGGHSSDFKALRSVKPECLASDALMFDLPGFGLVPPLPDIGGSRPYAAYVAALAHLGEPMNETSAKRFVIIGYSFGTRVALRLAAQYPEKIAGLFLVAPSGVAQHRKLRFRLTSRMLAGIAPLIASPRETSLTRFARVLASLIGGKTYAVEHPQMWPVMTSVMREDLRDTAAQVEVPVTLVSGTKDEHIPTSLVTTLASVIRDSQVHWLPYGHGDILTVGAPHLHALLINFLQDLEEDSQ